MHLDTTDWSWQMAAGYLAAMIDGEGTITKFNGNRARGSRHVKVSNTDPAIIEAIAACCTTLGIHHLVRHEPMYASQRRTKPIKHVVIYGEQNFVTILNCVPIQAPEKLRRLRVIAASFTRGKVTSHCIHGHVFDEANIYYTSTGRRNCRICMRAASQRYLARIKQLRPPAAPRSNCRRGHPWTTENILLETNGSRRCRTCRNAQRRHARDST